jgi:hypothetical protein
MNGELKKHVLESLRIGLEAVDTRCIMDQNTLTEKPSLQRKISTTIAALEEESDREKLTFDQIEACFPDGGDTNENGITVSAQWLHDFARSIESTILDSLKGK